MMPSHTPPDTVSEDFRGLTKREYFAARAMQGLRASSTPLANPDGTIPTRRTSQMIATAAVLDADALIEALNAKEKS